MNTHKRRNIMLKVIVLTAITLLAIQFIGVDTAAKMQNDTNSRAQAIEEATK